MPGFIYLADARILLGLNHALAADATLYAIGLFLAGKIAPVLMVLTALYLWFWPAPREGNVIASVKLPQKGQTGVLPVRRVSPELRAAMQPFVRKLNRHQSRSQVLLLIVCLFLTYLLVWLLADLFDVARPFVSFLDIRSYSDAFAGMSQTGAFPSLHSALAGAFVSALFYWNRKLAWMWLALAILFGAASVAVGAYYPSGALIGGFAGAGLTYKLFTFYRREGRLFDWLSALAKGFNTYNFPYHLFLYFFLLLFAFEVWSNFGHITQVLDQVKYDILRRF